MCPYPLTKNKIHILLFLVFLITAGCEHLTREKPQYQISENGLYILRNKKPFFYLADCTWNLIDSFSNENTLQHLHDIKRRGYTVIHAALPVDLKKIERKDSHVKVSHSENAQTHASRASNRAKDSVLNCYLNHLVGLANKAAEIGIGIGIWLNPEVNDSSVNPSTLPDSSCIYSYGLLLGEKFRSYSHVIWILGSGYQSSTEKDNLHFWETLAEGISDGKSGQSVQDSKSDFSRTFISFFSQHEIPVSLHNKEWIDFSVLGLEPGTSCQHYLDMINKNRKNKNPKPLILHFTLNLSKDMFQGDTIPVHFRNCIYQAIFSGYSGVSLAAYPVGNKHKITSFDSIAILTSYDEFTNQLKYLKELNINYGYQGRVTDETLIYGKNNHDPFIITAMRGRDYALIYLPVGQRAEINMGKTEGEWITAQWFNPRNGLTDEIGRFDNAGIWRFDPPGEKQYGNDWVLVIKKDNTE